MSFAVPYIDASSEAKGTQREESGAMIDDEASATKNAPPSADTQGGDNDSNPVEEVYERQLLHDLISLLMKARRGISVLAFKPHLKHDSTNLTTFYQNNSFSLTTTKAASTKIVR